VAALSLDGGTLFAEPRQVEPEFREAGRAGRYKKVSASFYAPDAPTNPRPGVWSLRHVGFMGAQPPAVKGLGDACFGEAEDVSAEFVEFLERDMADEKEKKETAEFAERQKELDTRAAGLAEQERQLDARALDLRRKECVAFCEALGRDGRLGPAQQGGAVNFMLSLTDAATVEFAEGRKQTSLAWFQEFLSALPKQVDFGETKPEPEASDAAPTARFVCAPGYTVSPEGARLHAQTVAFMEAHPNTSYIDAAKAVERGSK
jgi:hypothetical protein